MPKLSAGFTEPPESSKRLNMPGGGLPMDLIGVLAGAGCDSSSAPQPKKPDHPSCVLTSLSSMARLVGHAAFANWLPITVAAVMPICIAI